MGSFSVEDLMTDHRAARVPSASRARAQIDQSLAPPIIASGNSCGRAMRFRW